MKTKFMTYTDNFGDTQYLDPTKVIMTTAYNFGPKDENGMIAEELRGMMIGMGVDGYVLSRGEKPQDFMKRLLEHLDGDS
tara:strand:- start:2107 stop:2346 length:240 start_codon:yes stop_codon:yes gene_type:complete